MDNLSVSPDYIQSVVVHNAITADVAVGDAVDIPCIGAKAIALTLTEAGSVNNRSCVMTVYVSIDMGVTYVAYNLLIDNVANINTQEAYTHVGSKTRAAAGTDVVFLDPMTLGGITHFKVDMNVTDGADPAGTYTVKASIKF